MSRRGRAMHRVDSTAAALIEAAKELGFRYHAQDGTIDGVLWLPGTGRIWEVDWKSARGKMTPGQITLLEAGWQIRYLRDVEGLKGLRAEALLPLLAREGRG